MVLYPYMTTNTTNTTNNKYEILCVHEYELYKPCISHEQYRQPIDEELCNIYKTLYDSCLNFKKLKFIKTSKHST